jgi:hypothetical protein
MSADRVCVRDTRQTDVGAERRGRVQHVGGVPSQRDGKIGYRKGFSDADEALSVARLR